MHVGRYIPKRIATLYYRYIESSMRRLKCPAVSQIDDDWVKGLSRFILREQLVEHHLSPADHIMSLMTWNKP